jgi:tetratricopeptide (TPR) repeat protein
MSVAQELPIGPEPQMQELRKALRLHGGTLWGVAQEGRKAPGSGGRGERVDGGGPSGGTSPVGRQLEHMRRARALLELQRPKAALVEAQRALSLGPTDADALQLLGLCLVRLGDLAGARQASAVRRRACAERASWALSAGLYARRAWWPGR